MGTANCLWPGSSSSIFTLGRLRKWEDLGRFIRERLFEVDRLESAFLIGLCHGVDLWRLQES